MKPRLFSPFLSLRPICLAALAASPAVIHAQTAEIDPVGALPTGFSLAQAWEYNTDGNLEGWAGTNAGTVTVSAGEATGTASSIAPQWALAANLAPPIPVSRDVVVEVKVRRPAGNTNPVELRWADIGGALAATRSVIVPGTTMNDGNYHVVRLTFTGQIGVRLDRLQFNPHTTSGATFSIDYVRVFTNGGLSWDTNIALSGAQGGPGNWGSTFPTFWDGTTNATWPASGTTNAAIFGLAVDAVTPDAAGVAANVLSFPTTNTTQATGYTLTATGGALTLNGTNPTAFVNGDVTINTALAGTAGLIKKGHRFLYLGGNNSGLSGSFNIHGFPNGINAGVVLTSNTAIGGITAVNVLGDATYGGFFGLSGGVTLGSGVTLNLSSTGGATASAPPGALRSYGPGTVNTVEGPINVTLSACRISNNDAQRLDLTGAITAGANEVIFRNAVNEGIHLTNTGNSWSGQTTHSGGTLWAEPGTLPSTSRLVLTVSDPGVIQTRGTFDRALGAAAGQVSWQNVPGGARASGFSARGGDLIVNLGGAGVDLPFYTFTTKTGDRTINVATIANVNTAGLAVNMDVTGTGIGTGAKINSINAASNQITLSVASTSTGTGGTLNFSTANTSQINTNTLWLNGPLADGRLTFANPIDLNGFGRTIQVDANVADLSGGLKGAGQLNKTGVGTLVISGPSTWTGGLTLAGGDSVNRGIVRVTHNEGLGPVDAVKTIVSSGSNRCTAIIELAGGVTIDANKSLNMSGKAFYAATAASTGTQFSMRNLSGNNAWLGNVTIAETGGSYGIESASGTLTLGSDPATTSLIRNTAQDNSTRPMFLFGAGNFVIHNKIADNGNFNIGINHVGSGVLSLTRTDNDFDQVPNLQGGTTEVANLTDSTLASSLGTAASFNLGGTLRYLGSGESSNRFLGLLQKGATLDASGSGPLALTSSTLSHQTGAAGMNCAPFALGATVLSVDNAAGVAIGQTITGTGIASGALITAIDVPGRTITLSLPTTAASASGFGAVLTAGNANNLDRILTLTGTNSGDNILAANLSNPAGNGKLGLTKTGTGKWILSGATKTNTGPTSVQQGTLGILGDLPPGTLTVDAAATLSLGNATLTGSPALDIDGTLDLAGPVAVVLPDNSGPGTYSVLEYGARTGAGLLTHTYRDATFAPGATSTSLTIGGAGIALTWTGENGSVWDVKTSTNWRDASATLETFHSLDSVTFDATGSAAQPVVVLVGSLAANQTTVSDPATDYTFTGSGRISAGSLIKSGAAKLTIATNNTNTGGTTITAGTVEVGNGGTTGAIGTGNVTNDGILAFNRSNTYQYDGVISGAGAISKAGTGTTILTADQSYAGTTTITAGTLRIGNRTATGMLGSGAVVNDGNLQISRSDATSVVANPISGIGTVQIGYSGIPLPAAEWNSRVTLTGTNTFTGGLEVLSGGLKIANVAALGTGVKTIRLSNGTNGRPQLLLDGSAGNLTLPADFSFVTSSANLTHPAIGNLAGDNVIDGKLILTAGGGNTAVSVIDGSLTLNGVVTADQLTRVLILGGTIGKPGTINGVIADGLVAPAGTVPAPLALIKSDANTWTFTAANTYTGTTIVNGGLLIINGDQSAATGALTVATDGTLGGTGKLGGVTTVALGGTLAPGVAIGTLTTSNNVILDGNLAIDVNDTLSDKLVVGGSLDIGGATLNVTPGGSGLTQPVYLIAKANAPITGAFAATNVPAGYLVVVGYNDGVDTNNIALVQGTSDPYLSWADTHSLVGANRAPAADPDHDGLDNGIEFVIGSNPNTTTQTDLPGATTSGGNLIFTFKRSDASEAFAVYVEHSTNLDAPWTALLVPAGATSGPPITVVNNDPGLDSVTVTIPMGTDRRKFARLRADIPYTP